MTQFLLLQTQMPNAGRIEGLRFDDVTQVGYPVTEAGSALFSSKGGPVLKVGYLSGEADGLADEAREALLLGVPFVGTRLAELLGAAIERNEAFCLFWADDFVDLPRPRTREELFTLLEEQLRTDGSSNYELYARWAGDA